MIGKPYFFFERMIEKSYHLTIKTIIKQKYKYIYIFKQFFFFFFVVILKRHLKTGG